MEHPAYVIAISFGGGQPVQWLVNPLSRGYNSGSWLRHCRTAIEGLRFDRLRRCVCTNPSRLSYSEIRRGSQPRLSASRALTSSSARPECQIFHRMRPSNARGGTLSYSVDLRWHRVSASGALTKLVTQGAECPDGELPVSKMAQGAGPDRHLCAIRTTAVSCRWHGSHNAKAWSAPCLGLISNVGTSCTWLGASKTTLRQPHGNLLSSDELLDVKRIRGRSSKSAAVRGLLPLVQLKLLAWLC